MELHQSLPFLNYIKSLGWQEQKISGSHIIFKKFPFIGTLAKLQRPKCLPPIKEFSEFILKYKIRTLAVEPEANIDTESFYKWFRDLPKSLKINHAPYLQTKSIIIDLSPPEDKIFKNFTEAKQRAVRRALKLDVVVKESHDIDKLIQIKNKSAGLFGFITTFGLKELWKSFSPENAAILIAYAANHQPIAAVLLLFWEKTAYYWIAGATKKGKKLFAPTLLVWEALKLAKSKGCKNFDFVGVWDERMPKANTVWKGFTKFKEGFGGHEIYYPFV